MLALIFISRPRIRSEVSDTMRDMNPDCEICDFLQKPLKHQLLTPKYWTAGVLNDQPYLGRAIVSLRTHKGSLSELSDEEWTEFHDIVRKLEPAYQKALG